MGPWIGCLGVSILPLLMSAGSISSPVDRAGFQEDTPKPQDEPPKDKPASYGDLGIVYAEDHPQGKGLIVIQARSPATKAGIRARDIIVRLDEKVEKLWDYLEALTAEQTVKVEVLRPSKTPGEEAEKLSFEITTVKASAAKRKSRHKFRQPFKLTGVPPSKDQIDKAAMRGLEYLFALQKEDGSWKWQGDPVSDVAPLTLHAMTALNCMALNAYRSLAPDRVDPAVRKGLQYLMSEEAKNYKQDVAWAWTSSYCIFYLCQEYRRTTKESEKQELREVLKRYLRALLGQQNVKPKMDLLDDNSPEVPADQAAEKDPPKGRGPVTGGWGYYGTTTSFTTASAVLALMEARQLGFRVPVEAINKGVGYIAAMWGKECYGYSSKGSDGLKGSMARIGVCELALVKAGKRSQEDLQKAMGLFLEHRGELDRVLRYPGTHVGFLYGNAPYYYLYGHYHAAQAANALEDAQLGRKVKIQLQEVMMALQEEDGSWMDDLACGKTYGTAMTLMVLGEATK